MALTDKLTAIANGFRASRGTTVSYSLDEMAVLASQPLGSGGSTKLTLFTPSISTDKSGKTLSINDQNGGFVEVYDLYANGKFVTALTTKIVTLKDYIAYTEDTELKVQAKSANFNPSKFSSVVKWVMRDGTDGLAYSISSDGTYAICTGIGSIEPDDEGYYDIEIASKYNGVPVTKIDSAAFVTDSCLTSVVIPDSVTEIGCSAFDGCYELDSVVIGDGVTSIGSSAFAWCEYLTNVSFGKNVTFIGLEAFYSCSLRNITMPSTIKTIECCAFADNFGLEQVDFSNHTKVPTIDECVFDGADDALQIKVPAHLIDEWKNATNWSGYADYIVPSDYGLLEDGTYCLYRSDDTGHVVIPSTYNGIAVTTIGVDAFFRCYGVTSVEIPDSITKIGGSAFEETNIKSIVIPDSVTYVGEAAFCGCSILTSIELPDSVTFIGGSVFNGTAYYEDENNWENEVLYIGKHFIRAKETISGEYAIKDGTLTIAGQAFNNCDSLTWVEIPNSVVSIGTYAFYDCWNLTSVQIPNSVTSISYGTFYNCKNLKRVNFLTHTSVPTLGEEAFYGTHADLEIIVPTELFEEWKSSWSKYADCIRIGGSITLLDNDTYEISGMGSCVEEDVIIPATYNGIAVTSIGANAFENSSMTSVIIPNSVTSIGERAFYRCNSVDRVEIPNSVVSIGDYAFAYCDDLHSVEIPDSVTTIGNCAFADCKNLTSVEIPNSVTSIGYEAFRRCGSLKSIQIGNSVTSIGNMAFWHCDSLESVEIPKSVTSIGYGAFARCGKLTRVDFSKHTSVPSLEISSAFDDCHAGLQIIVPENLIDEWENTKNWSKYKSNIMVQGNGLSYKRLDNGTYGVDGIGTNADDKIVIPSTYNGIAVTKIDDFAFNNCDDLTSVKISTGITSIGEWAFAYCEFLRSVEIPDSVTTIDNYAFERCDYLGSVEIPNSVTSIGYGAFKKCYFLKSVELGNNVTAIAKSTFKKCVRLTSIVIPNSVTTIDNYAFDGCSSLTSVIIGDSVTSIGRNAFEYCESMMSLELGNSVTAIGDYAFSRCNKLTSITIPKSVTSIGKYAFFGCFLLTRVDFSNHTSVPTLGKSAFRYDLLRRVHNDLQIKVPAHLIDQWKKATNWSLYKDHIVTEFTN